MSTATTATGESNFPISHFSQTGVWSVEFQHIGVFCDTLPDDSDPAPFVSSECFSEWPLTPLNPLTLLGLKLLTPLCTSCWPFFGWSVATRGFSRYSIIPETNPDLYFCEPRRVRVDEADYSRYNPWYTIFFVEVEGLYPVPIFTLVFDDSSTKLWYLYFTHCQWSEWIVETGGRIDRTRQSGRKWIEFVSNQYISNREM